MLLPDVMLDGNVGNQRFVTLSFQDPVFANGRIIRFDMKVQPKEKGKNGSWESFPVNRSEAEGRSDHGGSTELADVLLADKKSVKVYVTAVNSVGTSPPAALFIPEKANGRFPW